DYSDEEIEAFYGDVSKTLKQTKSSDVVIVMGDFNAKVGNTVMSKSIGRYGLGTSNERGEHMIQFCEQHDMSVINTHFKQPKRRLYTWKSPGDVTRNQIDYLAINSRFKNAVSKCKTYPGADIGSDHAPVIMKINIKLKIPRRKPTKAAKYDVSQLKNEELQKKYAVEVKNRFQCLMLENRTHEANEENVNNIWDSLKIAITETNESMLPKAKRERKQAWMKEEILELMKERKKYKGTENYKELDRQVRKECLEAKEDWLNYNCYLIEELLKDNKPRQMYEEIKKFTSNKIKVGGNIKNEKGEILMETEQIIKRWSEFVEQLFDDHRGENPIQSFLQGSCILASEVAEALKHMKSGKACGIDGINMEMLKALGDFGIEVLTNLCNCMYSTAYIPEDLKTSVFILLPKKPKARDCSDYRTISLMCHILKLLLSIIMRRMSQKIEREISDRQTGFRKNSGTREAVLSLKVTAERYLEVHKEIFACFIDYSKAFDSVKHEQLIEILQIFRTIDNIPGLTVGCININNLRYADDTVMLAENEDDLQKLVNIVKKESEKCGLFINIRKTKTMVISREKIVPQIDIKIDGERVEQ
ncbi:RNA-directed DNA polymerase from mobile element jockey-like, partial [Elysia marginata]